jgi:hypothetical protein
VPVAPERKSPWVPTSMACPTPELFVTSPKICMLLPRAIE